MLKKTLLITAAIAATLLAAATWLPAVAQPRGSASAAPAAAATHAAVDAPKPGNDMTAREQRGSKTESRQARDTSDKPEDKRSERRDDKHGDRDGEKDENRSRD